MLGYSLDLAFKSIYNLIHDPCVTFCLLFKIFRNSLAKLGNGNVDIKSLKYLLDEVRDEASIVIQNKSLFISSLIFQKKLLTLNQWPFVLAFINDANDEIVKVSQEDPSFKRSGGRHCYLGQRLIPSGEVFFAFTPPGS